MVVFFFRRARVRRRLMQLMSYFFHNTLSSLWFAGPSECFTFQQSQVMAMLTPEAVGLVPYAHTNITPAPTLPGEIRYLHIAQESGFSIGIFIMPPGACIPLHDHPNM